MKTFAIILTALLAYAIIDGLNTIKSAHDERLALAEAKEAELIEQITGQCKLAFPGSDATQKWCVEESQSE